MMLAALASAPAWAQTGPVRVAYIPVTVRGDYQPLDAATVNELMLECLRKEAPELEFVMLQVDLDSFDVEGEVERAVQTARQNGAAMIAWGEVGFQRSAQTSRGDTFYRGRLKLLVTAIADIQVASVESGERILSQPTIVTSSGQSNAFTEDGDPETEKRLASDCVRESAKAILEVVRQRRTGSAAEH